MFDEDCLHYGSLGQTCAHLRVEKRTDWLMPWMPRASANVRWIVAAHPSRTRFTRFIPAKHLGKGRGIETPAVAGYETDVRVLGTVLGAVDRGYRLVLVTDALRISSDKADNLLLTPYRSRYGQQVETVATGTFLE